MFISSVNLKNVIIFTSKRDYNSIIFRGRLNNMYDIIMAFYYYEQKKTYIKMFNRSIPFNNKVSTNNVILIHR